MEHALRNQFQSLRSGMELLARAIQPRTRTPIDPVECLDLLKGHLARVEVAVAQLLALSATESQPDGLVDLCEAVKDAVDALPSSDQALITLRMDSGHRVTTPLTTLRRCLHALLLAAADSTLPDGRMELRLGPGVLEGILLELRITPVLPGVAQKRLAEACAIVCEALSGSLVSIDVTTDSAATSMRCAFKETLNLPSGTDERNSARVLVVDADRDAADSLAMVLELEGFEAKAAYSGDEARSRAGRERFDAVVINPTLPDMEGDQLADEIRNSDRPPVLIAVIDRPRSGRAGLDCTSSAFDHLIPRSADLAVLRDVLAGIPRLPGDG